MGEERVYFKSGALTLEGLFAPAIGAKGVVIAHPHPLMGGNMRDNVVMALASLFQKNRYSTLRFNFRSVGRSEGLYDNGEGEADDLRAAIQFLLEKGIEDLSIAGYSFGARMALKCLALVDGIRFTLLVSPPLGETETAFRNFRGTNGLIVCGDGDPFCPVDAAKKAAGESRWRLERVEGADHFFFGQEAALMDAVGKYIQTG